MRGPLSCWCRAFRWSLAQSRPCGDILCCRKGLQCGFWDAAYLGTSSKTRKSEKWSRAVLCEPSDELQESLGPSGPEIPKKSEKSLAGPPAPGSQNVWKKSGKSLEKVSKKSEKSGKSLENVRSGLLQDFLETFFQTFWGFRARRARETPVARGRVRKPCSLGLHRCKTKLLACSVLPRNLFATTPDHFADSPCFWLISPGKQHLDMGCFPVLVRNHRNNLLPRGSCTQCALKRSVSTDMLFNLQELITKESARDSQ